jgi:hypothetical protein
MLFSGAAGNAISKQTTVKNRTERILVMRHAEKTDDRDDIHLSDAGKERAQKLADFILHKYGPPDFIFAAKESSRSNRSYETLLPLSDKAGVSIDDSIKDKECDRLAQLLMKRRYAGKFIVIAWHHDMLPKLLADLHAPKRTYPAKWDSSTFNEIFELDYDVPGGEPKVVTVQEPF